MSNLNYTKTPETRVAESKNILLISSRRIKIPTDVKSFTTNFEKREL
jgi:hypothetical protein